MSTMPPYVPNRPDDDDDGEWTPPEPKSLTREERHPFAVRLFWIAVLVAVAGLILGIWFGVRLDNSNQRITKANIAIQRNDSALKKTNDILIEAKYQTCLKSRIARGVTINNAKAEKKLYDYLHRLTANSLKAAQIVVADPRTTPAALKAAKQRIADDNTLLGVVPHIKVPAQIAPCGADPRTGPNS